MRLRPGTQLQNGSFVIADTLGQGGFGITYRATDTSLNRPVALKEFFPNGVERGQDGITVSPTRAFPTHRFETFRAGFVEEGRMLAALDHPAIVSVYRVFEEKGTAYLVMKLLNGQTVAEFFEEQVTASRTPGLPSEMAVDLICSLEDVLTYLHGQDILHRDIKPANLFRLASGQIVLLDFGAARGFSSD